ncbi:MAG: hypothetical protein ACI9G1_003876 [Pirellulaceae bacterium]|jgi:hypothetical protein
MALNKASSSVQRFFAGVAEYIFQAELGVADPPLVDYLSDMLIRFLRMDVVHKVRALNGKPVLQVADMVAEADERLGDARRAVHQHIGDYTLFWAGLYPETLRKLRNQQTKDQFVDYCSQGKRAYWIASTIESSKNQDVPAEVLTRLSEQFEMCAYGLREVRREWERRDDDGRKSSILLV